jgi:integrase
LADARAEVGRAISKLDKGIDPGAEKIAAKKNLRDADSFEQLAHEWIERWAKPNRKGWKEAERQLQADAIPAWGKRKARDITRRDVIRLVEAIQDRGSGIMANRTLGLLKQVFKFGVQRGILEGSPAVGLAKPAKENRRDRVLSDDEIRRFWNGLDKAVMTDGVRLALRLCLVTGQRRAEVAGMCHAEIDGDWWTIPKERTKNGRTHRVPLSTFAKRLIQEASKTNYLFPSSRKRGPDGEQIPIAPRALTNAITKNRSFFSIDRFSPHDLRRTAATRMAEVGVSRFDISKVLNHSDHQVTAIYDRHSYDQEKKKALAKWSRKLQLILDYGNSNNVVMIS